MVYTLVTGRMPFEVPVDAPYALMHKHIHEMPPPAHTLREGASPALSEVIERAIAKTPTTATRSSDNSQKISKRQLKSLKRRSTTRASSLFRFLSIKRPSRPHRLRRVSLQLVPVYRLLRPFKSCRALQVGTTTDRVAACPC